MKEEFKYQETLNCLSEAICSVKKMKSDDGQWDKLFEREFDLAKTIQNLKTTKPEAWIPLRLALSCYLTQQTNVKRIQFPKDESEWIKIWDEYLKPSLYSDSDQFRFSVKTWFNLMGNHRFAKRFSNYYVNFWEERNFDLDRSKELLTQYSNLNDIKSIKKFWKQFDGVGEEYSKNLPMDEMNPVFNESIKMDTRLESILKGSILDKKNQRDSKVRANFFLEAGKICGLSGREIDRLCFNFRDDVRDQFLKCLSAKRLE